MAPGTLPCTAKPARISYVAGGLLVRAVLLLIGFTASIAQIALLREFLAAFGGNEMSIGIGLAAWLLWTGAGSVSAGALVRRIRQPRMVLAGLETLLACILPVTILGMRSARAALQAAPGESLGPGPGLAVALTSLAPLCLISGALFAVGAALRVRESCEGPDEATRTVYWLEALGSAVGGALAALVLIRWLNALQIAWLLGVLNLLAACCLAIRRVWARAAAACLLGALAVGAWLPGGVPAFERSSLANLWPGYRVAATRNSAYGSLAVIETGGTRTLYENGQLLFSAPDPENAEEAVHYALLQHPAPKSLLLIGGGFNGSLEEAARHRGLSDIEDVEFDPAIPELASRYFAEQWQPVTAQPGRIRVRIDDGRRYLKNAARPFDAIIVNLPEPRTAQLNRFYTLEFFREAAARLTPGGVLSFQLPGSESYISADRAEFLRSVNRTLRAAFPEVAVMPGETVHFFACKRAGGLARNADDLLARLRQRGLSTAYVREYYLPFRMSADRVAALEEAIRPESDTRLNRDFEPVAYYFNVELWSSQFGGAYARLFRSVAAIPFERIAFWLALLPLAAGIVRLIRPAPRLAAAGCVAGMGFTLIGMEVLLLFAFQALYGYVYRELAVLIAAFMGGMALGSWLSRGVGSGGTATRRRLEVWSKSPGALAGVQAIAAAAPVGLCLLFGLRLPDGFGQILFVCLALGCGLLGGYQFPLASRAYFGSSGGPQRGTGNPARRRLQAAFGTRVQARTPPEGGGSQDCLPHIPGEERRGLGTLYALDLAGSAAGAALFAAWLIPVFGFFRTALLAAELNLAAALLALPARKPRQPI